LCIITLFLIDYFQEKKMFSLYDYLVSVYNSVLPNMSALFDLVHLSYISN
jgi:hypothetical protein